jgi:hypothetical protein
MENSPVFRGSLEEKRIPEIIYHLSRTKETGTLFLKQRSLEKSLYLEEGKIIFAASNDSDDRLGALLLRKSKVTYRQLEECAPKVDPGKRLGTVLVLEGIIQPNELYHAVVDQIKEIVYSVFDWENGTFEFQSGPLKQTEVITLNLSTPDLIMKGMQRIWRWSWIRQALPTLDAVYRKKEGWSPIIRKMTLTREFEALLDLFDRPRTLDEALKISTIGDFETCRLMWVFLLLGVVEEILVAPKWTEEPGEITARFTPSVTESGETTVKFTPSLADPEIPAPAEQVAGPTLKLTVTEPPIEAQTPIQEVKAPVQNEIESLLADPVPFPELSFSDLAELTDEEPAQPEQPPSPALQPWELLILANIQDFNEIHRYLSEMIWLELGSGSSSFLSKAFRKASAKYPLVFEGVGIGEFGDLEESSLVSNIQGNLVQDYSNALDFLIAEERSMITLFLEMKRVEVIEAGLKRILNRRIRTSN